MVNKSDVDQFNLTLQDSLHYMKGWSYYAQKKLFQSAQELSKVSQRSPFYEKSRFFTAYNHAYLSNTNIAQSMLSELKLEDQKLNSLRHFEKAGIALLERDYQKFDKEFAHVDTTFYAISEESGKINQYATDLRTHQPKSAFLAGLMSSIIPGSGKIYAGKTGEGISSFLTVGGLGFVTWENFRKRGPKDFKTILFGSIFTIFHIGNVYGTVFSVKLSEQEFNNEYDHKILFNLHVPLRNVFN